MGLGASDYLKGKVLDHLLRTATWAKPSAIYVGLIRASRGLWNAATLYSVGDTVYSTTFNGRMYRCTTGGTSHATTQPTWPLTDGATVTDGTVIWTEHTPSLEAGTNLNEVAGTGYARIQVTQADAQWTAPGTSGITQNVNEIQFGSPSADWGAIGHWFLADAVTSGNLFGVGPMTSVFTVAAGNPAPKFIANAAAVTLG